MHEVEQFVSVREVPWHGVGTIVEEKMTSLEALQLGGLDWQVDKYPVLARVDRSGMQGKKYVEDIRELDVPDTFVTVRSDNDLILGVVGSRYTVVDNRVAFSFFDSVVDDGEAKYETAGSLDQGRTVFLTALLPKTIQVGGVDPVELYLLMANSHDGSLSFTAAVTPVRVVCRNTLNLALDRATQQWKMRHTQAIDGKLERARRALDLTFAYVEEFEKEAEALIQQEITDFEFEKMVKDLWPDKDAAQRGMFSDRQAALIQSFRSTPTLDDGIRHTKWGALNAVGEYVDWGRTFRKSGRVPAEELRAKAVLFGPNVGDRNKTLQYLTSSR